MITQVLILSIIHSECVRVDIVWCKSNLRFCHGVQVRLNCGVGTGDDLYRFPRERPSSAVIRLPLVFHQLGVHMRTMPRKGRRRSAAQIRQTGAMRKRRWDSPEETEMVDEMHRCMTFEEYRKRMTKAEQEAEKSRKDLKNAEKRVR